MTFFEDTTSFSFQAAPLSSDETLYSGLWLVLVGINEIPPHIALISTGKYYSLSTRKVDCGSSLERLINTLKRKHISSLFIKIEGQNTEDITSKPNLILENIYKNLQPLKSTENTCLSPIKEFFANSYSDEFASIQYIFELLALAQKKGLIGEYISLFPIDNDAKSITLPKYTMEQIKNRIHEISLQITSTNP